MYADSIVAENGVGIFGFLSGKKETLLPSAYETASRVASLIEGAILSGNANGFIKENVVIAFDESFRPSLAWPDLSKAPPKNWRGSYPLYALPEYRDFLSCLADAVRAQDAKLITEGLGRISVDVLARAVTRKVFT